MSQQFDLPESGDHTITNVGDLVAALPAMIGFVPHRSLVVVALDRPTQAAPRRQVSVVCRLDLPRAGDRTNAEAATRIALTCRRSNAGTALAFIVGEHVSKPATALTAGIYRPLHRMLEQQLAAVGITLAGIWYVTEVSASGSWWNIADPQENGSVPDPKASPVAARAVLDASTIYGCRAEAVDAIAIDPTLRDEVARLLPDVVADAHQRFVRALQINNPDAYIRMALWRVMAVLKQPDTFAPHRPGDLAEVAAALRDSTVRDALFGVAAGAYDAAAERLWTTMTRALSGTDRAEAATMLAFHAYLHRNGALAGIALDAALTADPDHRMANLLAMGLQTAMPPERLQRLVHCGIGIAADLRIDIGVAQPGSATAVDR